MCAVEGHRDSKHLVKAVREERITDVQVVPTMLRMMMEEEGIEQWGEIRRVYCGGEALSEELVEKLRRRREVEVVNLYGPTETAIDTTYWRSGGEGGERVSIGRGIKNARVYVMDGEKELAPIGVAGEVYIGGEGLARGYLNRPDLTAAKFLPDPFSKEPGARMYRARDIARRKADGQLEYIGRADQQVKVRGHRIELGEIESQLIKNEQVKEAAAIVTEDDPANQRIVAYVVGAEGTQLSIANLRNALKETLPDYMIPSQFVEMDSLPLMLNGKLNRRALPAPGKIELDRNAVYEAPRNSNEELVAGIWSEVLGIDRIGAHDNFFELGGHSLLATQVISRVREVFQAELSLRSLFEHPTVAGLASVIEKSESVMQSIAIPPIIKSSRDQKIPLSFAQQRLWFLNQLEPNSALYNVSSAVRLSGQLNEAALRQSLSEIVSRHESLRTVFVVEQGEPYQIVCDFEPINFPIIDISHLPEDEREAMAKQLALQEAQRPFDLLQGPMLRASMIRLGADDNVVLLSMHHIVADGWSSGLLVREIAALYEAFSNDRPSPLPELPIQYPDFAAWQRSWLHGSALDSLLSFWKAQLCGPLPSLELPTDFSRPALPSYRGSSLAFAFSSELSASLRLLARRHSVTLFMVLIAGFKALLHRYSGQTDIIMGCDIANRNRAEIEPLIGFFVNMLVLRTDLDSDPSFEELLRRVREVTLSAYHHQDAPFEKIVEALEVRRDPSRNPVFQANFVFQNAPSGELEPGGLKLSGVEIETRTSRFDMTVMMMEGEREVGGQIVYSTDLFERETIERMARQFERLLESAAENPKLAVSELELERVDEGGLQSEAIEQSQQQEWISAARMIERQVELTPDALAVRSAGEQLSYQQLNQRANQLAHYLRGMGVGPEVRVAVMMPAGIDFIVSLVAILKAGGVYTPIDEALPVARKAYMIESSAVAVILTQSEMADSLPASWAQVVEMDLAREQIQQQPQNNPEVAVDGEHLAYIIYTSGTTGEPKGVMARQAGLINHARSMAKMQGLSERDRELQFISRSFDASIEEMIPALISGAGLVMEQGVRSKTWEEMKELIRREEISVLHAPAAYWHEMVEEMRGEQESAGLRVILVGGESVSRQKLSKWEEKTEGEVKFINAYGPTEATITTTAWVKERGEEIGERAERVSIGTEIEGAKAYVVDASMRRVGEGIAGEVMIGGRGVARGYEGRADLTAERFIPDPFSQRAGARMYRTGDLGRRLRDGQLEYLGRVDEQVKVRGYRVEPAEVEAGLMSVEGVKQAAVAAVEDAAGGKRLVGWIVCEQEVVEAEVSRKLAERLPEYMRPSEVVKIERMPVTANGKVDRKALKAMRVEASAASRGAAAAEAEREEPEGEVERQIARVYEEVLGLKGVAARESFFRLGGDSIRSIRVVALLAEQGIEVSVQEVFEHQSVRELAQAVISRQARINSLDARADGKAERSDTADSRRVEAFEMLSEEDRAKIERLGEEVEDAYPLSQLQAGMVYHSELNPETAIYHSIISYHLGGILDLAALRSALDLMTARHQMLRASFDLSSYSEPLQLVHRQAQIPLQVDDISHLDEPRQAELVERWIEAERHRHFQWKQPPLVRVHIHKRSDRSFQFTLTAPHAIFDGWSDGLLLTEMFQLYAASISGERIEQQELASSYRDYVWQEREELRRGDSRSYWAEVVEGMRPTRVWRAGRALRDEASDSSQAEAKFTNLQVEFDESQSRKLGDLARRLSVPLKSVLLAAHLRVMQEVSGQAEVTTGVVSNGRLERRDGEKVIGLFLNTLPLRMRLEAGSWEELIREVFEAEKAMMKHRRYPLAQIQREAGGEELFETGFNYTHFHVYDQVKGRQELETIEARGVSETNFLMMASFDQSVGDGGVRMSLFINESEVGREQGERIAGKYRRAIEAIAERTESRYEQEELMSEEEKQRIESRWAQAKRGRYSETGIESQRDEHVRDEYFEEAVSAQASRSPHRVAIECARGEITYSQLEERTNRLARLLISRGAGPETLVAVCLSEGEQMVEAILATLKAGAGYVPVDSSYPKSRIEYMLEDSGAQVVISERGQQQKVEGCGGEAIWMDEAEAEIASYSADPIPVRASGSNVAYVIYTSGTTGQPKGVMIERRAMSNLLRAQREWLEVGEREAVMQFSSWSFDASVWEMMMGLGSGGRLVIREKEGMMDVEELRREMMRRGVTAATLPPSVLRAMREEELEGLKKVISAGEAWDRQIMSKWSKGGRRLVNAYGPTETTVCATMTRGNEGATGRVRSIGAEIRNVRVAIMDERMRMCGEGVEGEIWIGGEGVARGYRNQAELTADKFVPDPTSEAGGERMYRSGDRGRWVGGEIEYEGRADEQVKVRGHRIEVAEIEEEMKRIEWVAEAVVVARAEAGAGVGVELKGYVVIGEGWEAEQAAIEAREGEEQGGAQERGRQIEREIKRRMRERLPEWMMVSEIEEIAEAPVTASGKIDRQELSRRSAIGAKRGRAGGRREAKDEVEREMKRIWEEVMGEEGIGMEESFFEAGGHSLKATQIVTRVRERWGIELEMRGMFERPTIEGMSEMVRERAGQMERAAAEEEQIMKMLEGIENLSDDDVKRLIEETIPENSVK